MTPKLHERMLPEQRLQPTLETFNERPTLLWVRREYNHLNKTHLTSQQVAQEAGLPLSTYYLAEIGGLTDAQDVETILAAFSRLVGQRYTLKEVYIQVRPPRVSHQQQGEG